MPVHPLKASLSIAVTFLPMISSLTDVKPLNQVLIFSVLIVKENALHLKKRITANRNHTFRYGY